MMTRWRIHDLERLTALGAEWAELWRRDPRATPFQAPEWILAWLRAYEEQPVALIARHQGRLTGLAVFVKREKANGAPVTLELAGTGPSDYLDALVDPAFEGEATRVLLDLLGGFAREGVMINMRQLRGGSPLWGSHVAFMRDSFCEDAWCPALDLSTSGNGDPEPIPASFAKKLEYARRRAQREAGAEFIWIGPEDFDAALCEFFRLRALRWAAANGRNAADSRFASLLALAGRAFIQSGALRFVILRLLNQTAAALIGFISHGIFYYYYGCFDPRFSRHSPGSLIIAEAIRRARAEGVTRFDFLRGCEPYKFRWGAQPVVTYRRTINGAATQHSLAI